MGKFLQHPLNQRFRKVYDLLKSEERIRGKSDIAKKLGTYNHVVNAIIKGDRNITVDQVQRLCEAYEINANYLFGIEDSVRVEERPGPSAELPTGELQTDGVRQNITLVPDRALAGYALEHQDQDYLQDLPRFSVPNLAGELLAFEISGDSMLPTITNGDLVVCEPVERGTPLRDNHIYVIVTDVVVAKRIQQIKGEDTQLRLISDNGSVYRPYTVDRDEVRQILKVKCRITNYAIS